MTTSSIRNFVIIAHIDHGKSTLADRFLELTQAVEKRKMKEQYLDQLDLERERGITIKMAPVRMSYILNSKSYILNLIDTPGQVEGAILLVDAVSGIQAQTIANLEKAKEQKLVIIPVINKIDLPQGRVLETKKEVSQLLGCSLDEVLEISAKTGQGVTNLLEKIIEIIPSPKNKNHTGALIFDSLYDLYKGVIAYVRVFSGEIIPGNNVFLYNRKIETAVEKVGYFYPEFKSSAKLFEGEIGYIITGLKEIEKVRVGETIININLKDQKLKLLLE